MWNGKGETTEYADKAGNKNMLRHYPKLKSVLVFFLMLFGILGIGAGGLSGFIHYRGGLDVLVTDYVSRHYPALSISFSDLKWHVHIAGPVLTRKASEVELSYGEQIL